MDLSRHLVSRGVRERHGRFLEGKGMKARKGVASGNSEIWFNEDDFEVHSSGSRAQKEQSRESRDWKPLRSYFRKCNFFQTAVHSQLICKCKVILIKI